MYKYEKTQKVLFISQHSQLLTFGAAGFFSPKVTAFPV